MIADKQCALCKGVNYLANPIMFVSVLERQRAILEDGCDHTVVWQRYCRKLTFRACKPCPIVC